MSAEQQTEPASARRCSSRPPPSARHDPLGDRRAGAWTRRRGRRWSRSPRGRTARAAGSGRAARRRRRRRRAGPRARPSSSRGCRGAARDTSSSSTPGERARGDVVEHEVPAEDRRRRRRRAASATKAAKAPGVTSPRPHTGLRCCWALRSRPLVVISRSRWMASCGTRNSGRSTSRSRSVGPGAVAHHDPAGRGRGRGRATS